MCLLASRVVAVIGLLRLRAKDGMLSRLPLLPPLLLPPPPSGVLLRQATPPRGKGIAAIIGLA